MQLHRRDDSFPLICFSKLGEKFYDNFAKSAEKFSSFLEEYKTITNFFFIPVSIKEDFAVNTTSKYQIILSCCYSLKPDSLDYSQVKCLLLLLS